MPAALLPKSGSLTQCAQKLLINTLLTFLFRFLMAFSKENRYADICLGYVNLHMLILLNRRLLIRFYMICLGVRKIISILINYTKILIVMYMMRKWFKRWLEEMVADQQRLSNLFLFLIFIKILNIEKGRQRLGLGMLWAVAIMKMAKDHL